MGRTVIAVYKPKPGKEEMLDTLVEGHVDILRKEGLATDHPVTVMRSEDGTILEVFEWCSAKSVEEAHVNPVVQALWGEFGEACDFMPLASVPECAGLFPDFETLR